MTHIQSITYENCIVLGAKHLWFAGTAYCGNMEVSLDESYALPILNFAGIPLADRDGQRKFSHTIAKAPWYIGFNPLIMKIDANEYPVFSMRIKKNSETSIKGRLCSNALDNHFTVDAVPAEDGFATVTVDLRKVAGDAPIIKASDKFVSIHFYPYGDAEEAGECALLYAGFFRDTASAASFDPAKYSEQMKTYQPKYGKIDWRKLTDDVAEKYENEKDRRVEQIKKAADIDPSTIKGTCYYISSIHGDDSNDGLSPETAWKTQDALVEKMPDGKYRDIPKAGDGVFFERGSVFYNTGVLWNTQIMDTAKQILGTADGVVYSAYGEGPKPVFTAALDINGSKNWVATEYENVWRLDAPLGLEGTTPFQHDISNIVINNGEGWGIKMVSSTPTHTFSENAVSEYDGMVFNGFEYYRSGGEPLTNPGCLKYNLQYVHDYDNDQLYMYCDKGNPAEVFDSVVVYNRCTGIGAAIDVTLDNLSIMYIGAHGVHSLMGGPNLTIQNCEMGWIGGAYQEKDETIRYGNAVEVWADTDGLYIRDCYIYQVFDGTLSSQSDVPVPIKNIELSGNVLTYGNSPIEIWGGKEYTNISVHDNYMMYIGYHFGHQRPAKNASFNCGTGDYRANNWVLENNVMMYSTLFGHIGYAFASDYQSTGMISRNNVYVMNSVRCFFYRGFEDITVTYENGKKNLIYYPYTERYMQYLTSIGVEQGTTFYWYDYDLYQHEEERVYRADF